ncbi:MAG: DMT family transporter [Bacteroidales bacterium]|nr:DMT family transporter [Bacteroidales bacterium]
MRTDKPCKEPITGNLSDKRSMGSFWGYVAGIITGVTYGLNPLFAMPLMKGGAQIESILFFRYFLSVAILGGWLAVRKEGFKVSRKQAIRLIIIGLLFTLSSLGLFEAYRYIPSGLATTIVFLYPVFVAIIMVFMKVYPTWQVWLSIVATFIGVFILCRGDSQMHFQWKGILMAGAGALAYAFFIVIINRSRQLRTVSSTLLTFYSLAVGSVVFFCLAMHSGKPLLEGIDSPMSWLELAGLAILPTIVSTATLAVATRIIGATKASVMGVFEPVTAILVGALAFGEKITVNVITGIVLTMAAIVFMVLSSAHKKERQKQQ